jgi:acid phosphatase family membrane protein YuiD
VRMTYGQTGSRDEREHTAIRQVVLQYCSQSGARPVTLLCTALTTGLGSWEGFPSHVFAVNFVLGIATGILREFLGVAKAVLPLANQFVLLLTEKDFLDFKSSFFQFRVDHCE